MISVSDITEIASNRATYGSLLLAGLAALVAYMARKIWLDSSDKECERQFGFLPQKPLTTEQLDRMEQVIIALRHEFHQLVQARIAHEKANEFEEAGLLDDDVEYAEMQLSIALARAKSTAKRYAVDPQTAVNRLEHFAHQG